MPDTNDIIHVDATALLFDATLDAAVAAAFTPGAALVLVLADGQRFNITPVSDAAPRAPITIPENWSCSVALEATPESRRALDNFFLRFTKAPPTARQKARAAAKVLQVRHDKHVATLKSPLALTERDAAHRNKLAAKFRATPAERTAALDAINAPILQRRRLANITTLALDIAAKKGISPAEATYEAVQVLAQIEGNIAYRAALKKQRAAKTYPADGTAAHAASRYVAAAGPVEVAA